MEVTTVEISCHTCGVTWWLSKCHDAELRRTHAEFYCPGGHRQYYPSPTKAEKKDVELTNLRGRVAQQSRNIRSMHDERDKLARSHAALRGQITKLRKQRARANSEIDRFRAELEAVHVLLCAVAGMPLPAPDRRNLCRSIEACLRFDPEAEGDHA